MNISNGFYLYPPSPASEHYFTFLNFKPVQSHKYVPPRDKTNKMACAPSEDSDQPGHPPGHPKTLIRLGGCPG